MEKWQKTEQMRKRIYDRFIMWWMMSCGMTLQDISQSVETYVNVRNRGYSADYMTYLSDTRASAWPSFEAFLGNEYQKPAMMERILDISLFEEYLATEGFDPPHHEGDTITVMANGGTIVARDIKGVTRPGIQVEFVPDSPSVVAEGILLAQELDNEGGADVIYYQQNPFVESKIILKVGRIEK